MEAKLLELPTETKLLELRKTVLQWVLSTEKKNLDPPSVMLLEPRWEKKVRQSASRTG